MKHYFFKRQVITYVLEYHPFFFFLGCLSVCVKCDSPKPLAGISLPVLFSVYPVLMKEIFPDN